MAHSLDGCVATRSTVQSDNRVTSLRLQSVIPLPLAQ